MSVFYDIYLRDHRANVKNGYLWIRDNIPELLSGDTDYDWLIGIAHDESKERHDEYAAYDAYFYGGNRSYKVVQDFRKAWLLHIHRNPHHWQYWVLINDDSEEGEIVLEMPYHYILEMICDWWSFSYSSGNLYEIFDWYNQHKTYMKLAPKTRKIVEDILQKIKEKVDKVGTSE